MNPITLQLIDFPLVLRFIPEETSGEALYDRISSLLVDRERGDQRGFKVFFVSSDGLNCSRSPWTKGSSGTELPDDENMLYLNNGDTLAVEWDPGMLNNMRKAFHSVHHSVHDCAAQDEKPLSLYDCVREFASAEKLEGDEQVYCSKCKQHRDFEKRVKLYRAPTVLVVHLKRFQSTGRLRKIGKLVTFPLEELDLRFALPKKALPHIPVDLSWWKYMGGKVAPVKGNEKEDEEMEQEEKEETAENVDKDDVHGGGAEDLSAPIYDCMGVVNHLGSMHGGHYTAFVKHPVDKQWTSFDDSYVRKMQKTAVATSNAYMLFYMRRDAAPKSLNELFKCRHPTAEEIKREKSASRR